MKSLCIKTNNSDLLNYLLIELDNIELDNICFSCNQFKHYKNIIIHYTGNDINKFFEQISSILSFLVVDELEDEFLNRIILQNYFYFDDNERKHILNICYEMFAENLYDTFSKKIDVIYNCFYNYISEHKSIVLNGFVNFRLKPYFDIIIDIVSTATQQYVIEKEYLEFISLLKLYINSQPSNSDVVHVIYSVSDSVLLDENKEIIMVSTDCLNSKYLSDISFSSNDYILNSLLSLLPKKIYIHLINSYVDEFINTLQSVFGNRVFLCSECDICTLYKNSPKNSSKKNFQ